MAGRGVDIKLGEGVVELGGLYVLGTERHEARRIDNQLRGRSGRQGDPGESRFYLSAQDDLVRLFAGDRIYRIIERFKIPDDQPMEAKILSQADRERAEEGRGAELRLAQERPQVRRRDEQAARRHLRAAPPVLEGDDFSEEVKGWIDEVIERAVDAFVDPETERHRPRRAGQAMQQLYGSEITADELREDGDHRAASRSSRSSSRTRATSTRRRRRSSAPELMRELERFVILQVVDQRWREHLENMDYLREGVHLRAMAQKDPLVEYTSEGHAMFQELNGQIREEVLALLFHAQLAPEDAEELRTAQEAARGRERRRSRTSTSRWPGAEVIAGALGGEAGGVSTLPRAAAADGRRAREARPQRPVLVRLGQEVQEVPRRLRPPAPPLADDAIRLEPLDERFVPDFEPLAPRTRRSSATRASRRSRRPASRATWIGRYVRGLGGRRAGRASRSSSADGEFLGIGGDRRPRPATPGRARSATSSPGGARPRRRRPRAPAGHRLGARRARPRSGSSCGSTSTTRRRSGSPSGSATVREGVRRSLHFKEDIRADMAIYSLLPGDPRYAARGGPRPAHHPRPGWGLTPFPCRRGYPSECTRCRAGSVSILRRRRSVAGWPLG